MKRRRKSDLPLMIVLIIIGFGLSRLQSGARTQGATDPITGSIKRIIDPPAHAFALGAWKVNDFVNGLGRSAHLVDENRRLRGELSALDAYSRDVSDLQEELSVVRKAAGWLSSPGRTKVPASVIGYFPKEFRITLDVGKNHGIQAGMPVAMYEGYIGRVDAVNQTTCQALLITAPSSDAKLGAVIKRPSNKELVAGLIRSTSGQLQMELANPDASVEIGDVVITGGFSAQIPRGLVIGKVRGVTYDPVFGKKVAAIRPAVNSGSMQEVVVIK